MSHLPDFSFEEPLWKKGHTIIGIDEVGRGAFAGPVGIGGVAFSAKMSNSSIKMLLKLGINDSKKLSRKRREELSLEIKELAQSYFISFIDVDVINKVGIGEATQLGMIEVSNELIKKVSNPYLLIDAVSISSDLPQMGIIHGDCLSISIAAASIIAKVERDRLMEKLSFKYPVYGFDKNKGYGTVYHRTSIKSYGLSGHHRSEFCRKTLGF